jgi:hypothetical protein
MKKILVIAGALLALTAGMASATGINLFWNDCSPAGGGTGVSDQANACTANTGAFILMASLKPAPGIDACVGAEGVIDIQTAAATLSPWWQMRSDGCRPTSCSTQFSFGTLGSCGDAWNGQALGGQDYAYNPSDATHNLPNRARLRAVCAQPGATAGPLDPNTEWYIYQVTINKQKSVGTGSCVGCLDAACLVLNTIKITQPAGDPNGDPSYSSADQSQFATYRGAAGATQCAATPNQNRTWGSVKALYR